MVGVGTAAGIALEKTIRRVQELHVSAIALRGAAQDLTVIAKLIQAQDRVVAIQTASEQRKEQRDLQLTGIYSAFPRFVRRFVKWMDSLTDGEAEVRDQRTGAYLQYLDPKERVELHGAMSTVDGLKPIVDAALEKLFERDEGVLAGPGRNEVTAGQSFITLGALRAAGIPVPSREKAFPAPEDFVIEATRIGIAHRSALHDFFKLVEQSGVVMTGLPLLDSLAHLKVPVDYYQQRFDELVGLPGLMNSVKERLEGQQSLAPYLRADQYCLALP